MPYTVSVMHLPSGARYLHVVATGVISKEDADHLLSFVGEEGSMPGVPFVVMAEKMESVSPEAIRWVDDRVREDAARAKAAAR
ncbi:MAG TPA: hypothetical protein VFA20_33345 [Myxococcaceae bacterium]|nr:hypothetical protein [Myxococcaceae bacterium]